MKYLADSGKGAFYHTIDPSKLPQVFVHDIKVSTGEQTMKDDEDCPIGIGPGGLASTTVQNYPPLRGFVETLPKKGSTLELLTRRGEQLFPILASWNVGSGRVLAFTSDANGRWSAPWLRWPDFTKFWGQLIENIKDRSGVKTNRLDFDLRYSVTRKTITLDLAVFDEKLASGVPPRISARVIEPGNELKELTFHPVKRGRFAVDIENARPGDYRLDLSYASFQLPPLAITIGGDAFGEVQGNGVNVPTLEQIAFLSGGSINPDPAKVGGEERRTEENKPLFPPLVIAAFFLFILEAIIREQGLRIPEFVLFFRRMRRSKPPAKRAQGDYGPRRARI